MRISEKTVELNFCMGLPIALGRDLFWFGLTQKQEAQAGFDACTRVGSGLLLFQLKTSNHVLKNGNRRFLAEHDQMQALRDRIRPNRHIFYVLPVIGTTAEIHSGLCFSHCSNYLDVSKLPAKIPQPFAKGTTSIRKSNCHYIDMALSQNTATIHSEPFSIRLLGLSELTANLGSNFRERREPEIHLGIKLSNSSASIEFNEFWESFSNIDRKGLLGAFATY